MINKLILKVPAIEISQKAGQSKKKIYLTKIKARDLVVRSEELLTIDEYSHGPILGLQDEGYQRAPETKKVNEIIHFIKEETDEPMIPTTIVVCSKYELDYENKNGFGYLSLTPKLSVIDGQHRFKAFAEMMKTESELKKWGDFELPMIVLSGFKKIDEIVQFYIINSRQKKVKTDLAHRLMLKIYQDENAKPYLKEQDIWIARANVVVDRLNEVDNPWKNMMHYANATTFEKRSKPIAVSAFATSLKPLFKGSVTLFTNPKEQEQDTQTLIKFWNKVKETWPQAFINPSAYTLMKTIGVYVMHLLFADTLKKTLGDKEKALIVASNIIERSKRSGKFDSDFWLTKNNLPQDRIRNAEYAGAYSSASGHSMLVQRLIHN